MTRALLLLIAVVSFLAAPLAAQERKSPPNILFCIADDASPHFGAYGCKWTNTPRIDALARRGVIFQHAYVPTSKCTPCRGALLTGRNPWQIEAGANHFCYFPPHFATFPETLAAAGWHTGSIGKVWGPGTAKTTSGEPRNFSLPGSKGEKDLAKAFQAFLDRRPTGKPFFFWFGSGDPHRPYKPGAGRAAGKQLSDIDRVPGFWPDNDLVRGDMLDYATEIENYDAQVGRLIDVLQEKGELDNTLIVVTSDHGMPFPRSKGHTYPIGHHVPLIIAGPGVTQPNRATDAMVSIIDLAPTFLQLAGIDPSRTSMSPLTGRGVVDLLQNDPKEKRDFVLIGRERNDWGRPQLQGYPVRAILTRTEMLALNLKPDRWPCCNPESDFADTDDGPTKSFVMDQGNSPDMKRYWELCFGLRPAEELYDLTRDPDCLENLADKPAAQETKQRLATLLKETLIAQRDPRFVGDGDVFDAYPPAREDWFGKFEKLTAGKKK